MNTPIVENSPTNPEIEGLNRPGLGNRRKGQINVDIKQVFTLTLSWIN
jgi:hypothetical protein